MSKFGDIRRSIPKLSDSASRSDSRKVVPVLKKAIISLKNNNGLQTVNNSPPTITDFQSRLFYVNDKKLLSVNLYKNEDKRQELKE